MLNLIKSVLNKFKNDEKEDFPERHYPVSIFINTAEAGEMNITYTSIKGINSISSHIAGLIPLPHNQFEEGKREIKERILEASYEVTKTRNRELEILFTIDRVHHVIDISFEKAFLA